MFLHNKQAGFLGLELLLYRVALKCVTKEWKISCILFYSRSNHRRCSVKIGVLKVFYYVVGHGVLKNFANFTGKHLCWSLSSIKLQVFRPVTL